MSKKILVTLVSMIDNRGNYFIFKWFKRKVYTLISYANNIEIALKLLITASFEKF